MVKTMDEFTILRCDSGEHMIFLWEGSGALAFPSGQDHSNIFEHKHILRTETVVQLLPHPAHLDGTHDATQDHSTGGTRSASMEAIAGPLEAIWYIAAKMAVVFCEATDQTGGVGLDVPKLVGFPLKKANRWLSCIYSQLLAAK